MRSAIEEKLKTASVQRDENIKKMLERLKEHVSNQCFDSLFPHLNYHHHKNLIHENACMFMCIIQEEQVQKVRTSNALKFQMLETAVQEKLEQAQSRRLQIEQEQKEKLRNYVSNFCKSLVSSAHFYFLLFCYLNFYQNSRPLEVKQSAVSTEEVRKTEVSAQLETKLTIAEQKREQEIQRKLENAKKHVIYFLFA